MYILLSAKYYFCSNSSIDISVIIATQFTAFRKQPTNCDLDVKSLELIAADKNSDAHRKTLKVVEDIAFRVSGAVYRIHFNPDQAEYEKLTREYFAVLDEFEALLSKQPYIMGENISLADVIMYASIIRLPLVYSTMFRVNLKPMNDITYPNLWGLVKRIHNTGNVGTCIVPRAVKVNYYSSKPLVEKAGKTIPIGPMCDLFDGVCY